MGKKMLIVSISVLLIVVIGLIILPRMRSESIVDKAQNFVRSLQVGDCQNATRDFDVGLKTKMPPQRFGQQWSAVIAKAGPLKKYTITRVEGDRVHFTCTFEKGTLYLMIRFVDKKQIVEFDFSSFPV